MAPRRSYKCAMCNITSTIKLETNDFGEMLCNVCSKLSAPSTSDGRRRCSVSVPTRKSSRVAAANKKKEVIIVKPKKVNVAPPKPRAKKGSPKKINYEAPPAFAKPVLKPLFYKGAFYQHGDVVSIIGRRNIYYAQIRGLFQDQYGEKYAVITWLVPTDFSPKDYFDPDTYLIGADEEMPRNLDDMKFVCNAPSEHYMKRGQTSPPYPELKSQFGVLYKKTGPEIVRLLPNEEYYNPYDKSTVRSESSCRKITIPSPEPKRGRKATKKTR